MDSDEDVRANGASEDEQPLPESDNEGKLDQEELDEEAADLFDDEADDAGDELNSQAEEDGEPATEQKQVVEIMEHKELERRRNLPPSSAQVPQRRSRRLHPTAIPAA
jgi:hypothetical protein